MEKRYYIGTSKPTENIKQLRNIKESLIDNKIIDTNVPDDMISVAVDENLEKLKPENIKLGVKIGNIEGNYEGEGIQFDIPVPTNLSIIDGVLVFDPVDISEYAEFNPTLSYIVAINGVTELETTNTNLIISGYLNNGENTIEVYAKVQFNFAKNSNKAESVIEYSKPERYVYKLDNQIEEDYTAGKFASSVEFKGKIYVGTSGIVKVFDPTSRQFESGIIFKEDIGTSSTQFYLHVVKDKLYLLSSNSNLYEYNNDLNSFEKIDIDFFMYQGMATAVVDDNIYVIGGRTSSSTGINWRTNITVRNSIYKFNTETKTAEYVTKLPVPLVYAECAAIENIIYIFGGANTDSSSSRSSIYKFDTITKSIEELTIKIYPEERPMFMGVVGTTAVTIGQNIYLISGGYSYLSGHMVGAYRNSILKFNSIFETIEQLDLTFGDSQFSGGLCGGATLINDLVYYFAPNAGEGSMLTYECKIE